MGRLFKFLALGSMAASLAAAGVFASMNTAKETKADALETYIPMNADFFADKENIHGKFRDRDATYWNEHHSFNALDTFFDGCTEDETYTGTYSSRTWQQSTRYVYFTWGCASDSHRNDDDESQQVKIRFHFGDQTHDMFNDTFCGVTMTLRYFEIPQEWYEEQNGNSFTMSIDFIDNREGDYGAHVFGYLHVNQTMEQVSDACRYYVNNLRSCQTDLATIRNHYYSGNATLKAAWNYVASNFREDFEDNDSFQHSFYYDFNYGNKDWMEGRHPLNAISESVYRPAGNNSNMPFNKTGRGFFKGWYQDGTGYVDSDKPTYRFISKPFVLASNGIISVKMGGFGASLHLIDCTNPDEQADLAWVDCRTVIDGGEDGKIVLKGGSTVTMVRHVINFEEFAGRTVRVAIADVSDGGWGVAYFDELITNYDSYPGFKVDVVRQDSGDGTSYTVFRDKYVNSTHIDNDANGIKYVAGKETITRIDASDAKAASDFLNNTFYATLRNAENGYNRCSAETEDVVAAYDALSNGAKAIVNASSDYNYGDKFGNFEGNYYNNTVLTCTVGDTMTAIKTGVYPLGNQSNMKMASFNDGNMTTIATIAIVTFAAIAFGAFVLKAKRKHND